MLVVTRLDGEDLLIGDNIVVRAVECKHGKVKLGITAPREIPVHRREVAEAIATQQITTQHEGPLEADGGPPGTSELGGMVAFDHSQFNDAYVERDLTKLGITFRPNQPR